MISSIEWVDMARAGGYVKRYHSCRIIGEQSVAEHSFGVAMLVIWLTDGAASSTLIKAALYHDLPEQDTGDIPAPIKKLEPRVKSMFDALENDFMKMYELNTELNKYQEGVLKWADTLELLVFCTEQYEMGNSQIIKVFNKGVNYCAHYGRSVKGEDLIDSLKKRIENAS